MIHTSHYTEIHEENRISNLCIQNPTPDCYLSKSEVTGVGIH